MYDRRAFLASGMAVALVGRSWGANAGQAAGGSDPSEAAKLNALLDQIYRDLIRIDCELATSLGLDSGDNAPAKSRLNDRSPAGLKRRHDLYRRGLAGLERIDATKLSGMDRVNYDTFRGPWKVNVAAFDRFRYGVHSWPEPYTVSQLGGAYNSVPDFLINQHSIRTREDVEAYLARIADFAVQLNAETERLKVEYASGVIPPDFILARTLSLLGNAQQTAPEANPLVRNIEDKAKAAGIAGDWGRQTIALLRDRVYPALKAQAAAVEGVRGRATADAGVWHLPDGEAYYAYGLKYATTTSLTADEIHQMGLDQVAELTARADAILKAQGLTRGTVGERIAAMGKDPRFLYPNTDQGKADLIALLNRQMADIQQRLPQVFGRLPRAKVDIRRVPPETEAGAPGGYYQPPALDGSRPGAYYINLRDTAENPSFGLPTLTYHEATPGHHHQIALAQEATGIPDLRKLPIYSVYTEGWALYSEQLADELGMYANDPWGKIGYLQSYMFRAARLVVDTGLHAKRWPKEKAVAYMNTTLGTPEGSNITEVERYCVWPGQATSYKVGQTRWLQLRERAKAELGDRFDIRSFHDTALAAGATPLSALENVVDAWIAERKRG